MCARGDSIDKTVELHPVGSDASLKIRSDLSGANVTVDGIIIGTTQDAGGPELEHALKAGDHVLMVEPRDGSAWSKRIHISGGEQLEVDISFRRPSRKRKIAQWSLAAVGTAAVATGLTLGVLALSNVRSDSSDEHDRGHNRAGTADLLLGLGALSLAGAYYLPSDAPHARLQRSEAIETEPAEAPGQLAAQ